MTLPHGVPHPHFTSIIQDNLFDLSAASVSLMHALVAVVSESLSPL